MLHFGPALSNVLAVCISAGPAYYLIDTTSDGNLNARRNELDPAFVVGLVATMMMVWFERKVVSGMQNRIGPNKAGPFGLLQTLADGVKAFFKETFRPAKSDPFIYKLAPYLMFVPAFLALYLVPSLRSVLWKPWVFGAGFVALLLAAAALLVAAAVASHGIGTARAFQVSELAGTFAGIAMGLNGALTSLIILVWIAFHL